MRGLRLVVAAAAAITASIVLAEHPRATAQTAACKEVVVAAIRVPSVAVFDLQGAYLRNEDRAGFEALRSATDCGDVNYVMVRFNRAPVLVRRGSLQLSGEGIKLPPCDCRLAGNDDRNASSSGMGGANACDPTPCRGR